MSDQEGAATPPSPASPPKTRNMGIGLLGQGTTFIKKFRFTFTVYNEDDTILVPATWCIKPPRPSMVIEEVPVPKVDIEETEINYLSDKCWDPNKYTLGKHRWNPMNFQFWADPKGSDENAPLYQWLGTVYGLMGEENVGKPIKKHKVVLEMYDGCGQRLEAWTMVGSWPKGVIFQNEYAGEEMLVEVSLVFDDCKYEYVGPQFTMPTTPPAAVSSFTTL